MSKKTIEHRRIINNNLKEMRKDLTEVQNLVQLKKGEKNQFITWTKSTLLTCPIKVTKPIHHTMNYGYKHQTLTKRLKSMNSLLTDHDNWSNRLWKRSHFQHRIDNSSLLTQTQSKICTHLLFKTWLLNFTFLTSNNLSMDQKIKSIKMLLYCIIIPHSKKLKDNFIITTLF